jgi:AcrR family transcriptional regulator
MAEPHDPRANQKQRTRAAIVEAATRLMRSGAAPSVADAAEEAKVSRATAYRYFPTPEALHIEVAGVTPAYAPVEQWVQALKGGEVEERLIGFLEKFNAIAFTDEAQMRMALKVYLDTWFANRGNDGQSPPVREGRRMRWLERVLEPARRDMTKPRWQRLQAALSLTMGTESMVIMKDVCRLNDEEAKEVLLWAAQALLRAGLAEPEAVKVRRSKPSGQSKPRTG